MKRYRSYHSIAFAWHNLNIAIAGMLLTFNEPEWSLGESLPHTQNYGRIGFGFPKRWLIERGGQSVTYFRHANKIPFLRAIVRLLQNLGDPALPGAWIPKAGDNALYDLFYLVHFLKVIREPRTAPPVTRVRPKPRR